MDDEEVLSVSRSADMEWTDEVKSSRAKSNPVVARNSILYGNAITLKAVGEYQQGHHYAEALHVLDL